MYTNKKQYKEFKDIAHTIDKIFDDEDRYAAVFNISKEDAKKEIVLLSNEKDHAQLGDKDSRNFIINQYTKILNHDNLKSILSIDRKAIFKLIDFNNITNNSDYILFEMLLSIYDISEMIDKYNLCNLDKALSTEIKDGFELEVKLTSEDIKKVAKIDEELLKSRFKEQVDQIRFFSTVLFTKEIGQDIVDTLQFHNINEIGIRDKDYIYIVYKSAKIWLEFLRFMDDDTLRNILSHNAEESNHEFDEQNPVCISSKRSGARVTMAAYSVTPTNDSYYYNERIFNLPNISLEKMNDIYNTINNLVYEFLVLNQKGKGSFLCTGSDMGVGKSSFLSAMLGKVPNRWGLGIIDTQNELKLKERYPNKNVYTLIENGILSVDKLFEIMLKQARDVVGVGEINKPDEVAGLIDAALRLNAGACGTLHSGKPKYVVPNLRNLLMRTKLYNDAETAENDIAAGLDIIIHLAHHRKNNKRIIVESITEIQYLDHDTVLQPLIGEDYNNKQKLCRFLELGQHYLFKKMYSKNYKYNTIIQFDHDKDNWVTKNLPSENYFDKISRYVGNQQINEFIRLFKEYKGGK
ncbi:ATPase, T2SS/T4P/T4SS family [Vallitalea guaymasensis]|uniref:ATPase, T2SS/T4P/T4SS family n=1 Tax=Vallitalea guaymasensis TaxID=1185412 RepID=UPI000DE25C77|nr:ATPase, T2SS/T4P/T4SS family [Vallitalea guaymasensis]